MTITLKHIDTAEMNRRFTGHLRPGGIIKLARPDEERPAAGWYQASSGDITLDDTIEFDTRMTIDGLVTHEASHSIWSNWLTMRLVRSGEVTPAELSVIKTLEEARIETQAVNAYYSFAREGLRSCYAHLLADGFADPDNYTSVAGAVTCWALAWGRVHSGVVDTEELDAIDVLMRDRFGEFPMDCFDDLLGEFCTLRFGHWADPDAGVPRRAIRIAREWLDLVKSLQESEGEMDTEGIMVNIVDGLLGEESEGAGKCAGAGEATDGEGEGEGSGSGDEADDDDDADGSGAGSGEGEGEDGGVDPRVISHGDGGAEERYGWAEAFEDAVKGVSADPKRSPDVRRMSVRAKAARIWTSKKARQGINWMEREPDARHHRLVTKFARALERDAAPAVVRTRVSSQVPPGRLNGRGAMARDADRKGGRITTATPWRTSRRHHVERPPVIIGVATDTSGSMSAYTNVLGEVAWVTAHASKRVNAKFAAATFGAKAEPVIAVGEMPAKIRIRSANSGLEAFDDGMAALDGPLRLTDRSIIGRKLLIVVSDAELVRAYEMDKALLWLKALADGGTDVIWVGTDRCRLKRECDGAGIKVTWVDAIKDAEGFVDAIMENLRAA